jgi:tyrosyl-tRNA synthetase
MESWQGAQLNKAKEILAKELTAMIHGEEEAKKSQESAKALFSQGSADEMPTVTLSQVDFEEEEIDILSLLVRSQLVTSKSEARRAVQQGGVIVDGEKITNIQEVFNKEVFGGEGLVVKKGKKSFKKVILS